MARPRINLNMICSTEDYHESKKRHLDYITKQHEFNKDIIKEIMPSLKKVAYVKVFGELVQISDMDAHGIEKSVNVIYM
jgi:uncharacterized protein YjgD (DUF1641 family)